jgi:hypothetical protein
MHTPQLTSPYPVVLPTALVLSLIAGVSKFLTDYMVLCPRRKSILIATAVRTTNHKSYLLMRIIFLGEEKYKFCKELISSVSKQSSTKLDWGTRFEDRPWPGPEMSNISGGVINEYKQSWNYDWQWKPKEPRSKIYPQRVFFHHKSRKKYSDWKKDLTVWELSKENETELKYSWGFEVLAAVVMKNSIFRDITSWNPLKTNGHIGENMSPPSSGSTN